MKKVLLIGVEPLSLINFRGPLIHSIEKKGCNVIAVSSKAPDSLIAEFKKQGIQHQSIFFQRNGMNPIKDLKSMWSLRSLFLREKPDFVLCYTIKPVIWGGLAARFTGTKFFALVTGLGFAFQGESFKRKMLTKLVSFLYRISLSHATKVVFQNADNRDLFTSRMIVPESKTEVVNGSGVDISLFNYQPVRMPSDDHYVFLCVARLLGEKGLREFEQASEIVKQKYPNIKCQIVGWTDPSPDGITVAEVKTWQEKGTIEYLGGSDDVRPLIAACHIYVLPSYHEGLPRSTVEAMAMGRPVITTSAVGCRETVDNNVNGFKVPVADADALAEKMIWFIENPVQIEPMGLASRRMAEEKFDVHKVNARMLEIIGL
ncbi:galacturonosyltransferase WbtD [uncultured Thiomicrorhabdus sp.]